MIPPVDHSYAATQRSMIANVLSQYAWAYDLDRLDFLDACFARDAQVEFGDTGLEVGRAAVVAVLRRLRDNFPGTSFRISLYNSKTQLARRSRRGTASARWSAGHRWRSISLEDTTT